MLQRLCPRCHHAVSFEDETSLVYCNNCGTPQIFISEELIDQNSRLAASLGPNGERVESEADRAARLAAQPADQMIQWKSVLQTTVLVCGVISLVCLAVPLEILSWLAPGVVLGVYATRHRETKITTSMGARIGFVCGLLCAFGITITKTVQMLVIRYALHRGDTLDTMLTQQIVQSKARAVAQSGAAAASAIFDPLLNTPEFRVGFYLAAIFFGCLVLMGLSTLSGAFSGYMRSRRALR